MSVNLCSNYLDFGEKLGEIGHETVYSTHLQFQSMSISFVFEWISVYYFTIVRIILFHHF